ncbi:MAG: trehalose-phosphatase [Anaerolineae bacterium]|nr:trehalose-phosphatase [Anaerolineae bacterium]
MYWHEATETLLKPLTGPGRVGLISDMDGTLSPIVDQPDAAQITPRSKELLAALQKKLALVALVSGRAVTDLTARAGLPQLVYMGNHGLEKWVDEQVQLTPEALQHRPALEAALRDLHGQVDPGMLVEDKGATLSIHYRQTADPAAAEQKFSPVMQQIATQHGLRCFAGRMIFELRPPIDVDKGSAFEMLVRDYRLDAAVYLGDDTTDADALSKARQLREQGRCHAVGIGVESADMPVIVQESADLMASGVSDVESFLSWLLSASSASST